jgi:hypothetical protein
VIVSEAEVQLKLHVQLKRTATESLKLLNGVYGEAESLPTNLTELLQRMIHGLLDSFHSAYVCSGSYLFLYLIGTGRIFHLKPDVLC